MQAPGLILAIIATLLIAYAVPAWSRRRHAVATSRVADRFSDGLVLLEQADQSDEVDAGPSSRPIFEGVNMSEQSARDARRATVQPGVTQAAREYAALRARRAARLSAEKPAAQRRLVLAGLGVLATLVVVVLAAVGTVGWLWVALPAALLGLTLALSAVAGERAARTSAKFTLPAYP